MDRERIGRLGWRAAWLFVLVAFLAFVVALCSGCAVITLTPPQLAPAAPRLCLDQRPPKLLLDAACRDGICGYTCEPGRWSTPSPAGAGGS